MQSNVVAIDCGFSHSVALLGNGTVVAWGSSAGGVTNVPTGLTNVVAIDAGAFHDLALVGNGPPVVSAMVSNITWNADGLSLSVPSQSGRVYQLQYKNSLADSNWTSLPLVAGNGKTLVLKDATAGNSQQRIYRVLRW